MVWTLFLFLKSTHLSILHTSGKFPVLESLVSETGFAQYRASPDVQSERPNEVEYYLVEHPDLSILLMPENVRSCTGHLLLGSQMHIYGALWVRPSAANKARHASTTPASMGYPPRITQELVDVQTRATGRSLTDFRDVK